MKAKIDKDCDLMVGAVHKCCPFNVGECCGKWCPLFVEKMYNVKNFVENTEKDILHVEIFCGCSPVTFEIVEDERNK